MKKVRIVERVYADGSIHYVIQQKHFIFIWWWVDAWMNSSDPHTKDSFVNLEEAKKHLCYFNGKTHVDKVVF